MGLLFENVIMTNRMIVSPAAKGEAEVRRLKQETACQGLTAFST
jgi:hypothetical protein